MILLLSFVVNTANILGIFNDPFEFAGNYGADVNPVRQKVFELVVAKEALAKNYTDAEVRELMEDPAASDEAVQKYRDVLIAQGIEHDRNHGPTLSELIPPALLQEVKKKQQALKDRGFSDSDFNRISDFLSRYGQKKIFYFFRNNPPELLSLDKILRDQAARSGHPFDLPILGSTGTLKGQNSMELKRHLLDRVFTIETLASAKPQQVVEEAIEKLKQNYLQQFLDEGAQNSDLEAFSSAAGQTFFYWAYQSLNLHLISPEPKMIEQINKVKLIFAQTLGNPIERAAKLREKLIASEPEVLFTQESDRAVPLALTKEGLFLPIDKQNPQDGTFIFLRGDAWEPDYEAVPIEGYEGYINGRLTVILAKRKKTSEKFLLASAHGHSTRSEDGRLQITLVMDKFHQLAQIPENKGLQLVIGIDANTKTKEDVRLFREHLDHLGLVATHVGPTTIKRRMVTAQNAKAGKWAVDEEDYLIILQPGNGGKYALEHQTVGFKEQRANINNPLPNLENQSDHYPVGAELSKK